MRWTVFLIRAILGVLLGLVAMRFFYPQAPPTWTVIVCAALVGLAYAMENYHKQSGKLDKDP